MNQCVYYYWKKIFADTIISIQYSTEVSDNTLIQSFTEYIIIKLKLAYNYMTDDKCYLNTYLNISI